MQTLVKTRMEVSQLVPTLRAYGVYVKVVTPKDFGPAKWTVREVDLSDSTIHPLARVEANVILKSIRVRRWLLAEEIERPLVIPWKALAQVVGVAFLVCGTVVFLPVILLGLLVVAALAIDPMLICELEDGTWLSCGWWWHSSGK